MKKVALHNLGCKVNAYETESIQQQFEESGYCIVPFAPGADIYIINTCTVTNIADRKSRQMLHKAKKMNPDAVVVAMGCYVQTAEEHGKKDEAIDVVIGNNKKKDVVHIVEQYLADEKQDEAIIDINDTNEYESLHLTKTAEHTRAYIKVQDGCNQFCSYCIIPYARGRVRSREMADVLTEVRHLADNGYQEIVLTGIHLSSYGIDLDDADNLLTLIENVHQVEGIERIRLGSLEPRIITAEFLDKLSVLKKVCPHFHLSLQSGCEATLKSMNRRYTAGEYYEKCCLIREYYEHPSLTTDIIVGFPGETVDNFRESFEFVDKIGFHETHIFKYSKRQGTKAAEMDGQVPEPEKTKRSKELQQLHAKHSIAFRRQLVGTRTELLLEEQTEYNGETYFTGYTREYVKGIIKGTGLQANQLVSCKAAEMTESGLVLCVHNY